jgi:hypothetical protein
LHRRTKVAISLFHRLEPYFLLLSLLLPTRQAKVSRRRRKQVERTFFDAQAACSDDDDSSSSDDDDEGDGQYDGSMIDDTSQDNDDPSNHRQVDNDLLRDDTNTGAGREDVADDVDVDDAVALLTNDTIENLINDLDKPDYESWQAEKEQDGKWR